MATLLKAASSGQLWQKRSEEKTINRIVTPSPDSAEEVVGSIIFIFFKYGPLETLLGKVLLARKEGVGTSDLSHIS